VKIPVRDTEVEIKNYDKAKGVDLATGTTTYLDLAIDRDKAVNELIDGFDAASVPDGIVAERLDSAGYSLALDLDKESIGVLEGADGATVAATKTACTETTAYKEVLAAKRTLSRKGVPNEGRWLIVAPEYLEVLMLDEHFIKQGDLAQNLVQQGVIGRIAGFNVLESNNMDYESTTRVEGKKTTTEFIAGHPNWCHRVQEWQVPVHIQDLAGSGNFIGASAVQGRKVYGLKVSKPQTLYIKRVEA
jgi:N4-gp56 family major capsid protein